MNTTVYTREGRVKRVNSVKIGYDDTPAVDAFSRLRTGHPLTLFESKTLHDNDPLAWADATTSGTATSTFDANTGSVTLAVDTGGGAGARVRQTWSRFAYQAGKSMQATFSFTLGAAVTNVTKRIGYFDDANGLFLQQTAAALSFVARSSTSGSPVDTAIAQSAWNLDAMDGSGASRVTLDVTRVQTLVIDFDWPGGVRFGFQVAGQIIYAHQILNANVVATVFMSTPNLPARYEISSDAAATAALVCFATSVSCEAGSPIASKCYAIDSGIAGLVTSSDTNVYALIGYQLRTDHPGARARAVRLTILCASASFRWALLLAPTVANTFTYSDVTNTALQMALGDTANTVTGGFVLASGYGSPVVTTLDLPALPAPGLSIAGTPAPIVLVVQNLIAGATTYYGSIHMEEFA